MSDTPRTDDLEKTLHAWCGDEIKILRHARELERELMAARSSPAFGVSILMSTAIISGLLLAYWLFG